MYVFLVKKNVTIFAENVGMVGHFVCFIARLRILIFFSFIVVG